MGCLFFCRHMDDDRTPERFAPFKLLTCRCFTRSSQFLTGSACLLLLLLSLLVVIFSGSLPYFLQGFSTCSSSPLARGDELEDKKEQTMPVDTASLLEMRSSGA